MSQISPPIRILLVGAVVLAAAWVMVLKPKNNDNTTAAAPVATPAATGVARNPNGPDANTSLGKAVQKAEGASQTSDATNSAIDAGSGGAPAATTAPSTAVPPASTAAAGATTATKPGTSSTTTTPDTAAAQVDGIPAWLDESLGNKTVAILFWDKKADDDQRTHDAFKAAYTDHGNVLKRSVPISKIADYGKVARGVDVSQSPTIMIIDQNKNASSLVGYSNTDSINQAIIDGVLAKDNPAKSTEIGRAMVKACDSYRSASTIGVGDLTFTKDYKVELANVSSGLAATLHAAPKVKAGPLSAEAGVLRKLVKSEQGVVHKIKSSALGGKAVNVEAVRKATRSNDKLEAKAGLMLNAVGVNGCQ
ncbi:MAG: hypothetical protein QOF76_4806 [Solirubrobacteraceae bacterium]|nr:hypothetical protein [Solirubrobacteraceae bacterium]